MTIRNQRMHFGQEHERSVMDLLIDYGWIVQPWGQGLFTDQVRAAIGTVWPPVRWRWIPDLIAVRGKRIYLVDPKTEIRSDTPNFSIEQDAVITHHAMAVLGLRIVYVFSDFSCNLPERLKPVHITMNDGRLGTFGSGTPYILVRKADQMPFDAVFGPKPAQS